MADLDLPPLLGGPKVVEETSELAQALMKAAYTTPHRPTKELMKDIEDECADALAAIHVFIELNSVDGLIDRDRLQERVIAKARKILKRNREGDLNGLRPLR
jgi:NTP pyrophosphatase (non-canonical NTP hydrolase)